MLAEFDQSQSLKIYINGFNQNERRLVDATIKLSQRRKPSLMELGESQAHLADVIMIDCRSVNPEIFDNPSFRGKTIITVDEKKSEGEVRGDLQLNRPIQWTNLPQIILKALSLSAKRETPKSEAGSAQISPTPTASTLYAKPKGRILVVDDSDSVRTHLDSLLRKNGLDSVLVASAEEAIAVSRSQQFSCILMDVVMPGIDGYEACRVIKSDSDTPVVMLTSKSSPFDKIRGKLAGCDAYLTKPTTLSKLMNTINIFVTAKPQASPQMIKRPAVNMV